MTGYGKIDILWLDGGQVQPRFFGQDIHMDRIASMARKNQPGLIVVDRTVKGEFENYQTPEGEIPAKQLDIPWETCMPMHGWGWRSEGNPKPLKYLLASLIEVVAKGGNFMLGVGPTGEGVFDEKAIAYVRTIGNWMKRNGKAIYATRTTPHYNDGNVWFTASKDHKTLYAIYALPDKQAEVPEMVEWTENIPAGKRVTLVQNGKRLKCEVNGNRVKVWLPKGTNRKESIAMMFNIR